MIKIQLDNIDYISNGEAVSAAVLNKPSVDLRQNTEELKRSSEILSQEADILGNISTTLVIDNQHQGSYGLTGGVSPGYITTTRVKHSSTESSYYFALRDANTVLSQIELSSRIANNSKFVLKQATVSSYFDGYSTGFRHRRLNNNGDSVCLKIARQTNPLVNSGARAVYQKSSLGTGDLDYTAVTQEGLSLAKLPVINLVTMGYNTTIAELKNALMLASNSQYTFTVDNSGNITFVTSGANPQTVAAKFYVSVPDICGYSKVSKLNLTLASSNVQDSDLIKDLVLDLDSDGAPWNYNSDSSSLSNVVIYFKRDNILSYTTVFERSSWVTVPTQEPDQNFIYWPIATLRNSVVEYTSDVIPAISIEDMPIQGNSGSYSLVRSGKPAPSIQSLHNRLLKLGTQVVTTNYFSQIYLPNDIADSIAHSAHSAVAARLVDITVRSVSVPSVSKPLPAGASLALLFRSDLQNNTWSFPGIVKYNGNLITALDDITIKLPLSGKSTSVACLDTSSYYFVFDQQVIQEAASNSGKIALITCELTDTTSGTGQLPPGISSGGTSEYISTTNSEYKIIVEATILLSVI